MQTHDPHTSDPEREPTPERKWWSRFERRSEEERSREHDWQDRERAKQLKQAAKGRGRALETGQGSQSERPDDLDEPEIAPEGRKLRKKWRRAMLKKAVQQLEEFRSDNPAVIDGYYLAQLMVAERIIQLNEHLLATSPKTTERRQTKTELDFMGLLAEKLSSPDLIVPDEITHVHDVIVAEATHASPEAPDFSSSDLPKIDVVFPTTSGTSPEIPPTPDRSEQFAMIGRAVIVAVILALRPEKSRPAPDRAGTPARTASIVLTPGPTIENQPGSTAPASNKLPADHLSPISPPLAAMTQAIISAEQQLYEQAQPSSPRLISKQPQRFPVVAAVTSATSTDSPMERPVAPQHRTIGSETLVMTSDHEAIAPPTPPEAPDKPFDFMSLHELLALAAAIDIGHGTYLKRAFETGQIDREGLIKVLKAKKRGHNYRHEYAHLAAAWRQANRDSTERSPQLQPPPQSSPVLHTPSDAPNDSRDPTQLPDKPSAREPSSSSAGTTDDNISSSGPSSHFSRHIIVVTIAAILLLFALLSIR